MKPTNERMKEVPIDPITAEPCRHVQRRITEVRESGVAVWNCRDCGHWAFARTMREFDASMPSPEYLRERARLLREVTT